MMKLLTSVRGVQGELQIDQKAGTIPIQGSKISASRGATRAAIGNLLEEFKTKMLSSFASQIDTL